MRRTNRDDALEAGQRWYAQHGRPDSWQEWEHSEPGRPSSKTISRGWGWHAFWTEVTGIEAEELYLTSDVRLPASERHLLDWSSQEMLEALRTARRAEGRWLSSRAREAAAEDHRRGSPTSAGSAPGRRRSRRLRSPQPRCGTSLLAARVGSAAARVGG
jgi:hypothetical protein